VSSAIVAEYARLVVSLWSRGQHLVACPSWLSDSSVMVADRPLPSQLRTWRWISARTAEARSCLSVAPFHGGPLPPPCPSLHPSALKVMSS